MYFFPGCNFSKSNRPGIQPLKHYIFSLVLWRIKEKASLYLLSTVALVEKLPRPKPLLLQRFDGRLKLVASRGRRINLMGGLRSQQAVWTLRLALEGIISVFLGSVGWKTDTNWTVCRIYTHTNVEDGICYWYYVRKGCSTKSKANPEDLGSSLCSREVFFCHIMSGWMCEVIFCAFFSPPNPFKPN